MRFHYPCRGACPVTVFTAGLCRNARAKTSVVFRMPLNRHMSRRPLASWDLRQWFAQGPRRDWDYPDTTRGGDHAGNGVSRRVESTAGQVGAELSRRGIAPDQHVTITIEPDDWLAEVRRFARARIIARGLSDPDIDRMIDEERDAVQPRLG
jgi:hypothetical protein